MRILARQTIVTGLDGATVLVSDRTHTRSQPAIESMFVRHSEGQVPSAHRHQWLLPSPRTCESDFHHLPRARDWGAGSRRATSSISPNFLPTSHRRSRCGAVSCSAIVSHVIVACNVASGGRLFTLRVGATNGCSLAGGVGKPRGVGGWSRSARWALSGVAKLVSQTNGPSHVRE